MTVKLVALYRQPHDVDAFIRHYEGVHLPLVARTHLIKTMIGKVTGSPMGTPPCFPTAEMFFP